MYFKQLLDERCGCASYLIASRQTGDAAIVDPAITIDQYDALLAERSFRLRYAIDTHVHADHVSGARALAERHGATVCLHESAAVTYPFQPLVDGEELALGQLRLRVIHTPGHAPGAVCLYAPDLGCVFTGDTLFQGGPGATGRSYSDRPTLEASIRARLFGLPEETVVHTGHGDDTTIGAEKALLGG